MRKQVDGTNGTRGASRAIPELVKHLVVDPARTDRADPTFDTGAVGKVTGDSARLAQLLLFQRYEQICQLGRAAELLRARRPEQYRDWIELVGVGLSAVTAARAVAKFQDARLRSVPHPGVARSAIELFDTATARDFAGAAYPIGSPYRPIDDATGSLVAAILSRNPDELGPAERLALRRWLGPDPLEDDFAEEL